MIRPIDWLQAVVAAPESNAPRLRYADACRETDPDRAELIEVQVRMAQLTRRRRHDEEYRRLLERERVLLPRCGDALPPHAADAGDVWTLHRGFPEALRTTCRRFADDAPQFFRAAPLLHLRLVEPDGVVRLSESEQLGRIVSLHCDGAWEDRHLEYLLNAAPWRRLARLDLRCNLLTDAALDLLCSLRERLPSVRWVGLTGNRCAEPADRPIDDYDAVSDRRRITGWTPTLKGRELEARFGPQPWLHFHTDSRTFFPPWPDEFVQFEDEDAPAER